MAQNKLRIKGVNTGGGGGNLTDFISVWDTTFGDSNPLIVLPLVSSGNYNFIVNWGDGNTDTITAWDQAEVLHTYATGGTYTVKITGTIEGWSFNGVGSCPKLTSITNIGQLKLGNEGGYFEGCSNLTTIGGTFDLAGTTNFSYMFSSCTLLTSVNGIGSWNTSAVTNMEGVFYIASSFNQNISGWNTSAVTNMGGMFYQATVFNGNISSWDTSAVTDMSGMFQEAIAFNQDISEWDVSSVTGMNSMFYGTIFNQPLNSWNVSSVTDMGGMFANAAAFNQPLNSWDTSAVTDMNAMFASATSFNQDISGWDVSSVTNMLNMFAGTSAFNQPLNSWDVSAVTNMGAMFGSGKSSVAIFNQPLNSWDVSSVTDMGGMFNENQYFNQDISAWDVSSVTYMNNMFDGATSFNQDISGWNTSAVTNMGGMFGSATAFNQNISSWDVSSVTDMSGMFANTTAFNQSLNSWDTSAVTNMGGMFDTATSFNQDISGWDVSSVTDMKNMFSSATSFNQNISGWNISNVVDLDGFMANKSTADYSYYNDLLNAWSLLTLQTGVLWVMGSIEYTSAGATARQDIIDNYSWTITDGGLYTIPFVSVWDTTLGNGNLKITLPLVLSGNYNFTVNWGDGNTDTITAWDQEEVDHTYATGGTYTVTITGTIEGWSFNGSVNCAKITSITDIGCLKLGNEGSYFQGCSNLTTIGGTFDLTGTTNFNSMFNSCTSLTSVNGIGAWDTAAVTNMDSMFREATSFNQPLNSWDTSAVTDMNSMFRSATTFNQNISGWDISSVTTMANFMGNKSTANYSHYDNLLNAWSLLTLQNGVTWDMGTIQYTSTGATARDTFENKPEPNWRINDGGLAA